MNGFCDVSIEMKFVATELSDENEQIERIRWYEKS